MKTPRALHTATLLPNGEVLVLGSGGRDGDQPYGELYSVSKTDEKALVPSLQPLLSPLVPEGRVEIQGNLFQPFFEASGGNTRNSATNYPLLQLRRLDNEQTLFLPPDTNKRWSSVSFAPGRFHSCRPALPSSPPLSMASPARPRPCSRSAP
jgi:hypothetical protein